MKSLSMTISERDKYFTAWSLARIAVPENEVLHTTAPVKQSSISKYTQKITYLKVK